MHRARGVVPARGAFDVVKAMAMAMAVARALARRRARARVTTTRHHRPSVCDCVCARTRYQNITVYGLLLNTILSNGPMQTKYVYYVHIICLLSFTVRLFSTIALHRSPPRRRRRPRDAALTVLFASRVVVVVRGASSSSFIGTHHAVRDVAFTRAIIRARVVVARVVGRRATRCDIGGA